jgi:hypothetical protein
MLMLSTMYDTTLAIKRALIDIFNYDKISNLEPEKLFRI